MKQLFYVLVLLSIAVALPSCAGQTAENIRLQDSASKIQRVIQNELNSLDADLASAAKQLTPIGVTGDETKKVLQGLLKGHPCVIDCGTMDMSGRLAAIMPAEYSSFEGSDISAQDHVVKLLQTKQPVFSHSFKAVEGFQAVVLTHPVFSDKGDLSGTVWALIRPEIMFEKLAKPEMAGTGLEDVWAMQTDGLLIFDYHPVDIGTNLFSDAKYQPYTELVTLGKQIAGRETGCGSYSYTNPGDKEKVKKQACWSSASLRGVSWRIIVTQVAGK